MTRVGRPDNVAQDEDKFMSLADYYRNLREYESMLAERKHANLAASARQNLVSHHLKSEERAIRQAASARGRMVQARAGRVDQYGEPIVFIDGYSTNMTATQYADFLMKRKRTRHSKR